MAEIREYLLQDGTSPYAKWFDELNAQAAAKVATAIARMTQGNFSNAKGVGAGVHEYRIDFGPGIEFILEERAIGWSFYWAVEQKSASKETSEKLRIDGPITGAVAIRKRRIEMPLTRDFKETIQARARRDAAFREALLKEAVDALLSGDIETGKIVLRDYNKNIIENDKVATWTKK